ncbi:MAG: putative heme iron utilization protein [Cyclobacteriaceae bacterium]|jgi:putative heme iron utilization protein
MSIESINDARRLFNSKSFGILSTLSLKLEGFPFGSVVPYCLDNEGMAVVLISTIAEHTKNISNDDRCSITIIMDDEDVQSNGRLCVIGNMELLSPLESDVRERYYRHFPNSKTYNTAHDFFFYRLRPISLRYIGGFGKIYWFDPSDFQINNPFRGKVEIGITDHMNKDHQKDLVSYCEHYKKMPMVLNANFRMVGIDSLGFDLFVNDKKVRFDFEQPVNNALDAREALVALSKGAK